MICDSCCITFVALLKKSVIDKTAALIAFITNKKRPNAPENNAKNLNAVFKQR